MSVAIIRLIETRGEKQRIETGAYRRFRRAEFEFSDPHNLSAQFLETKNFTSAWENFFKARIAPRGTGKGMVRNENRGGSAGYLPA